MSAAERRPRSAEIHGAGSLAEQLAARRFVVGAALTPPAGGWAGDTEQAAAVLQANGIGLVVVQPRENARTHMDSLNMALQLQQRVGVETIATVTTWDKTIMSLQADLLGAHALGIRSVVSTTGSPPVLGDYPAVDGTWEVDSVGLTALLAGLNAGRDSNGLALTAGTSFCIGARVNPGARDPEAEIARAHAKIRPARSSWSAGPSTSSSRCRGWWRRWTARACRCCCPSARCARSRRPTTWRTRCLG